jgi:hypothetical protein
MSHRFLRSMGGLAVAIAVVSLPAAALAQQDLDRWSPKPEGQAQKRDPLAKNGCVGCVVKTGKTAAKKWTSPRTPWGDPDLQGIWNDATITPFQRAGGQLGEKDVLEDEDAEELLDTISRNRRDGVGTEEDVARAYNDHWMDHGTIVPDRRPSLIVDPPDGRVPPLTPEARKRMAAGADARTRFQAGMPWSADEGSLPFRCIIRQDIPPYRPSNYNNDFQIFQSPGYVVVLVEMIHHARIIPLDGRPHLGQNLRQWLGDTRGHWDGNSLVLETTNFRPDGTYGEANAATFHLVERFTRVDADTINYQFRVEDPMTWTKPWAAMIPWNRTEGQLYEYACHEGNYDMVHLLSGGRAREKAAEEAAKKGSR